MEDHSVNSFFSKKLRKTALFLNRRMEGFLITVL